MQQNNPSPNAQPQRTRDSLHRLSTSSEESDVNTQHHKNNEWQTIKSQKRNKTTSIGPAVSTPPTKTQNRYATLAQEETQADPEGNPQPPPPQNYKPPPIFIHGVTNYDKMIKCIREVAEDEQYFTKSMANNVIKLTSSTPDTYRNIIKHFKENGIFFHTYQLKEERAYRVVLKYLHHSTDVKDIHQELLEMGHVARNIVNAHHRQTKVPLNLFFVDLEPADNNKDVYNITSLQNKIILIEPPRLNKKHIPQCVRCQQYGHTRTYCNKPYACVKCGGPHNSSDCVKQKDTPAKCALCGGNHPANYKGCEHYHNIIRGNNPHRNPSVNPTPSPTENHVLPRSQPNLPLQQRSYAEVVRNDKQQAEEPLSAIKTVIEEFKGLFTQLLHQNSLILNMLSTIINNKQN